MPGRSRRSWRRWNCEPCSLTSWRISFCSTRGKAHYFVAAELLRSLSADATAGPACRESDRLYSLWTEIYADRWACHVCDDVTAAIAALIKIETGLSEVSADSYLRQAEEIFAKSQPKANQVTHPEPYIRARALRLWAEQGDAAQAEIERMIEGRLHLRQLDLLGQKKLAAWTQEFLQVLLAPRGCGPRLP